MKKVLVQAVVLTFTTILLWGCASTPPVADSQISLPVSFEQVWYRATLERPGLLVMTDTGTVTVGHSGLDFRSESQTQHVRYEDMQKVSFGKVGTDFLNNWVIITYRIGEADSYALLSGGKAEGWGSIGVADQIFQMVRVAVERNGRGSIVERK